MLVYFLILFSYRKLCNGFYLTIESQCTYSNNIFNVGTNTEKIQSSKFPKCSIAVHSANNSSETGQEIEIIESAVI